MSICSKRSYPTMHKAKKALRLKQIEFPDIGLTKAYHCRECGAFHLTKSPYGNQAKRLATPEMIRESDDEYYTAKQQDRSPKPQRYVSYTKKVYKRHKP